MATTQAVLRGFGLLQSIREVDSVQASYARSSHRPIGNRASKCHETLQPLDLSGSVTVAGHTADSQESRPGSRVLSEVAASPPLPTVASLSGACGSTISRAAVSHADGLSGISEAVSLESSSGLGLLSMASSCLVIVHMSWVPSAGLVKGEAPFHCGLRRGTCVHRDARSQ